MPAEECRTETRERAWRSRHNGQRVPGDRHRACCEESGHREAHGVRWSGRIVDPWTHSGSGLLPSAGEDQVRVHRRRVVQDGRHLRVDGRRLAQDCGSSEEPRQTAWRGVHRGGEHGEGVCAVGVRQPAQRRSAGCGRRQDGPPMPSCPGEHGTDRTACHQAWLGRVGAWAVPPPRYRKGSAGRHGQRSDGITVAAREDCCRAPAAGDRP
mmetsp:Transcript_25744/g.67552  ORF Transcript_25744/g.67552 Transcript_25744/m.67552 type:complete len:210 (-) Transcript_25744:344-973(-)